jgi:hypothetical protein
MMAMKTPIAGDDPIAFEGEQLSLRSAKPARNSYVHGGFPA